MLKKDKFDFSTIDRCLEKRTVEESIGELYHLEDDGREIKVGFNNMIYDEDEIRRIAHVAFKAAQKRKKRVLEKNNCYLCAPYVV